MRAKYIFFSFLIGTALLVDLVLGTSSYPKLFMMCCAIVILYESISPYIYTPS